MRKSFGLKNLLAIVGICLSTMYISTTQAQTTTWTGTGDGTNWFDGANWDNGTPGDGDSAIISSVGSDIVVTGQTANLASFTMDGGTLTFSNWTTKLTAETVTINDGTISHFAKVILMHHGLVMQESGLCARI